MSLAKKSKAIAPKPRHCQGCRFDTAPAQSPDPCDVCLHRLLTPGSPGFPVPARCRQGKFASTPEHFLLRIREHLKLEEKDTSTGTSGGGGLPPKGFNQSCSRACAAVTLSSLRK